MAEWDPRLYNRFRRYRAAPFDAILERLTLFDDEEILDLGCGTGENTIDLLRRSGSGKAVGVDSSAEMIEAAERLAAEVPATLRRRITFRLEDMRDMEAEREYSLIFSNAAIHWIGDHPKLFEACFRALLPGGRLVVQMPANDEEAAQRTIAALAREEPWRARLGHVRIPSSAVASPAVYRAMLAEIGFEELDSYYHTFAHPMPSPDAVIQWCRATTLRPFLNALPPDEHVAFLGQLERRLENAYGTSGPLIFNFRRLFIWARRAA